MFGHDNHQQHHDTTLPAPAPDGALAGDDQGLGAPQVNDTAGEFLDDVTSPNTPQPGTTTAAPSTASALSDDDLTDDTPAPAPTSTAAVTPDTDKLLDIKQQALQQLTPLVGHLEQTPEEKFRTTMMMIQAADNHELIQVAYEAAQQITDEKARAQALLDIVNEINYFTHTSNSNSEAA